MSVHSGVLPKIEVPPIKTVTPEEIERRRVLYERAQRLRTEAGPIGITTAELIRQARGEAEETGG